MAGKCAAEDWDERVVDGLGDFGVSLGCSS